MRQAVESGSVAPPCDLRYLKSGRKDLPGDSVRGRVVTFLEQVYTSQAETLPDFRDSLGDDLVESQGYEVPLTIQHHFQDPYAEEINEPAPDSKQKKFRQRFRTVKVNEHALQTQEVRHLPPGSMKDIWEQFRLSGGHDVSFTSFWRTWRQNYPNLKFRSYSSHAICSECIHHKLLIKDLSHHIRARNAQQQLYVRHLDNQYQDRISYWRCRASSRIKAGEVITIIDGMDQAKFAFPRSSIFRTKSLAKLQRGRAHVCGLIAHGYHTMFMISPPELPKDATTHIEYLAHSMSVLKQQGAPLQQLHYIAQCDNTSRECKNNFMLKFLSFCVANSICGSVSLRSLRSGHSHEDIDQEFGNLAKFLATRVHTAATLEDFREAIARWQSHDMKRPNESEHHAILVNQVRDWCLWLCLSIKVPIHQSIVLLL